MLDEREALERKLMNRISKSDLYDRGIIQYRNNDHYISQKLSDLERNQKINAVTHKLLERPTKQDLVMRGILDGQDYDTTTHIRKCISEHLITRPGPLDVYQHLVEPKMESENSQNTKNSISSYSLALSRLKCKTDVVTTVPEKVLPLTAIKQPRSSVRLNAKYKNLKFHEFVPGKSGRNGHFVRSDLDRTSSSPNKYALSDHYRQLMEQQSMFLQLNRNSDQFNMEYANNYEASDYYDESFASVDDDINMSSSIPSSCMQEIQSQNIDFNLNSHNSQNENDFWKELDGLIRDYPNKSTSYDVRDNQTFLHNEDLLEDPNSSGYGTSLQATSDSCCFDHENFYNLGFGILNDCVSFNSVGEKIKLYEKLDHSVKHRPF